MLSKRNEPIFGAIFCVLTSLLFLCNKSIRHLVLDQFFKIIPLISDIGFVRNLN